MANICSVHIKKKTIWASCFSNGEYFMFEYLVSVAESDVFKVPLLNSLCSAPTVIHPRVRPDIMII